jgi:hypothetical protein
MLCSQQYQLLALRQGKASKLTRLDLPVVGLKEAMNLVRNCKGITMKEQKQELMGKASSR